MGYLRARPGRKCISPPVVRRLALRLTALTCRLIIPVSARKDSNRLFRARLNAGIGVRYLVAPMIVDILLIVCACDCGQRGLVPQIGRRYHFRASRD
jgi:hypothetical protein